MNLKGLLEKTENLLNDYVKLNNEFGEFIVDTFKDIIPDLKFSLGYPFPFKIGEKSLCLCFFSNEKDIEHKKINNLWIKQESFDELLQEFINQIVPDNKYLNVECPLGIFLSDEEVEEVKKRFKQLENEIDQISI